MNENIENGNSLFASQLEPEDEEEEMMTGNIHRNS